MNCYRRCGSHDSARQRLQERFRENKRIEFHDLLRYLEDASVEPGGEDAYALALSIRSMNVPEELLHRLFCETEHRLRALEEDLDRFTKEDLNSFMNNHFSKAHQLFATKMERKYSVTNHPDGPGAQDAGMGKTSRPPPIGSNVSEDPELAAARDHGYKVSSSLRERYKALLFHRMAALAVCWTCFKPSSTSSGEPSEWAGEDTIRMFP
jgi:hypothetical protein